MSTCTISFTPCHSWFRFGSEYRRGQLKFSIAMARLPETTQLFKHWQRKHTRKHKWFMLSRRYFVQILRRGESETSFLIDQTRPVVVNFLALMPCFVFTRYKEKARARASTRNGNIFILVLVFSLASRPFSR